VAEAAAGSGPYQPFSGHASFPSGHATLAFATATALDRETRAGWVPLVAYPLAALVGWSRVRDDQHWTSDVVAGAALGAWTAAKAHDALRGRQGRSGRLGIHLDGRSGAIRTAVRLSY
jgi:membrane-associated phospholipid phosphatase